MPEDRKTNINNLIIVWQGQSWSTIAPDGRVLGRFASKRDAFEFARGNRRYVRDGMPVSNYLDRDFIEFKDDLVLYEEKPKRSHSVPPDGEWDDLPPVYGDEYPAKRKPSLEKTPIGAISVITWLRSASGVRAIILLVVVGFIISVLPQAGALVSKAVTDAQVAISNINWVAVIVLSLGVIGVLALSPSIISLLLELVSGLFEGCLGCLPVIGLITLFVVVVALCRTLVF